MSRPPPVAKKVARKNAMRVVGALPLMDMGEAVVRMRYIGAESLASKLELLRTQWDDTVNEECARIETRNRREAKHV